MIKAEKHQFSLPFKSFFWLFRENIKFWLHGDSTQRRFIRSLVSSLLCPWKDRVLQILLVM